MRVNARQVQIEKDAEFIHKFRFLFVKKRKKRSGEESNNTLEHCILHSMHTVMKAVFLLFCLISDITFHISHYIQYMRLFYSFHSSNFRSKCSVFLFSLFNFILCSFFGFSFTLCCCIVV